MKRLGIDFGTRRWGISCSDELAIAVPLDAIISESLTERWDQLERLVGARQIEELVVGVPYNMDGTEGKMVQEVRAFMRELKLRFPGLPVREVDERLSSEVAGFGWNEEKKRKERKSGKLDSRAAALLLQDYLDAESFPFSFQENDPFLSFDNQAENE